MNQAVNITSIADATKRVDAREEADRQRVADNLAKHVENLSIEWDLRGAQAIEAVTLARHHDGRSNDPWSADDAARVRNIADLLHCAAGQYPAQRPFTMVAIKAAVTERKLDPRVSEGIAAGAPQSDEPDADHIPQNGR